MSFVRDLRVALHSFLRTPGLALAVILTLALGIGANASLRNADRRIVRTACWGKYVDYHVDRIAAHTDRFGHPPCARRRRFTDDVRKNTPAGRGIL